LETQIGWREENYIEDMNQICLQAGKSTPKEAYQLKATKFDERANVRFAKVGAIGLRVIHRG